MKKVLVLAVHPDDETLGCGGTLLRHRSDGDQISWCIVTDAGSQAGCDSHFQVQREEEISQVAARYQFYRTERLHFPAAALDSTMIPALVERFSAILQNLQPEILYLPFHGDVHTDHRITFQAIFSCTKSFRAPSLKKIYMMETLSETEFAPALPAMSFTPTSFVDITPYLEQKLSIMECYGSELSRHPFPRSLDAIRALALRRGSIAGVQYAEAFMLLREIR